MARIAKRSLKAPSADVIVGLSENNFCANSQRHP
jgi:hypothetical protein